MGSAIDQIVSVQVTSDTVTVQQTSFGIPLIAAEFLTSKTTTAYSRIRMYSSLADMVADGWLSTDLEYAAAAAVFSQSPAVKYLYIGRRDAADADWATALNAIQLESDAWYGFTIIPVGGTTALETTELLQAAAWTESQTNKIFVAETHDANVILSSSTTDAASQLMALKCKRTLAFYRSGSLSSQYAAAALLGKCLPYAPGSATWCYKSLSGVSTDALTVGQKTIAHNKRANTYCSISGVDVFETGIVGNGDFIDNVEGVDWLIQDIQSSVFGTLASSAKVSYDDGGITAMGGLVKASMKRGAARGIIEGSSISVTWPDYSDIPVADRQARNLPDIKFGATYQGAIQTMQIVGTVSV